MGITHFPITDFDMVERLAGKKSRRQKREIHQIDVSVQSESKEPRCLPPTGHTISKYRDDLSISQVASIPEAEHEKRQDQISEGLSITTCSRTKPANDSDGQTGKGGSDSTEYKAVYCNESEEVIVKRRGRFLVWPATSFRVSFDKGKHRET